jgi:hypothetical protein
VLTLVPKSWYSWDFRVMQDGVEVAFIDRHLFRERATFTLGGTTYDIRRTSMWRGEFVLERDGAVIAEATKPSLVRRRFEVVAGGERYGLHAVSTFGRAFHVLRGGVPVGRVVPVSMFRRTATAEMPATISTEVQLFMTFLVLAVWKRMADAAAASG